MSCLRLVSAGLIFLVCASYGFVFREREKKKSDSLSGLITDLKEMENEIRFGRKNNYEIISYLSENGIVSELWKETASETKIGRSFREAFIHSVGKHVDTSAADILHNKLSDSSAFESSAEAERIGAVTEVLEEHLKTVLSKSAERSKLVLSLSLLAGAAAAIIVM